MKLTNKYAIGVLVQGYEKEMLPEYLRSCQGLLDGVNNPENIIFDFCVNVQEHFEKYQDAGVLSSEITKLIEDYLPKTSVSISHRNSYLGIEYNAFYSIADYRRDLNDYYCDSVDFVLWGETDSMWPKQTLEIIESITAIESHVPKFVLNFAGRKNWDSSWDRITHPMFRNVKFVDTEEWALNTEASEKSYMTYERMNEINDIELDEIAVDVFDEPKADGSCLVISSELIRSGVNIPMALIMCGEDESFLRIAKRILGNHFVQYHVRNILRVHNRRHPRKRVGILNENNPHGFCDDRKGSWWKVMEKNSKINLENLFNQFNFIKR